MLCLEEGSGNPEVERPALAQQAAQLLMLRLAGEQAVNPGVVLGDPQAVPQVAEEDGWEEAATLGVVPQEAAVVGLAVGMATG